MNLIIDTDIIIDYLRGNTNAVDFLESQNPHKLNLSTLTLAELYAGVRPGKETIILNEFFKIFTMLPLTAQISIQGGLWRRDYGKSHGTGIVDALIAATAQEHKLTLITKNKKHYPMLKQLIVPYK